MKNQIILGVLAFIGLIAILAVLLALPLMLLWNWLMPEIFGLTTISFWQALGLNLLSGILFGKSIKSNSKKES